MAGLLIRCLSRSFLLNSSSSVQFSLVDKRVICCTISCFRSLQAKGKKEKDGPVKIKAPTVNVGMSDTICSGANYFTTGEDPKLKDDSEYPDWLWTLLDEPSEDSKTYRRRQNKLKARANNKQMQRQH